jgi:hypothetical protein
MMHLFRLFTIAALLAGVIPCPAAASNPVKSLQGLFSDQECELVPEFQGVWSIRSETYTIREIHDRRYWIIDQDADSETGNKLALELCVAHLDGRLFYDATFQLLGPGDKPTLPSEFVVGNAFAFNVLRGFWVPMHIIGRLEIDENVLHVRALDNDWLQAALKSRLVSVTSAQDDSGEYFLTAPRKELKAFAARLAKDPKAFSDQEDFTRVPERKSNAPL